MIHRYSYPKAPPYAVTVRAVANPVAADGHGAHIAASTPSYHETTPGLSCPAREDYGGMHVRRFRLLPESKSRVLRRSYNALIFPVLSALEAWLLRRALVTFSTVPPVALRLVMRLIPLRHCRRSARHTSADVAARSPPPSSSSPASSLQTRRQIMAMNRTGGATRQPGDP